MQTPKEKKRLPLVTSLIENFGFSPGLATIVALFLLLVSLLALIWVIRSAPPHTIVMTTGPEGSTFERWALLYQSELAKHEVKLELRASDGSLDNLKRLQTKDSGVDIGFVQSGLAEETDVEQLVSLGSVAYQPLWIFYRGNTSINRLSELAGKRVAVGAVGSGTRALALTLLQANGITGAPTMFLDLDATGAAAALLDAKLDAVFLMGDSASLQTLRGLMRSPDVKLFNFKQADAYVRRLSFLNKIELPEGAIDLGKDLPGEDVAVLGPTVELVARRNLNSSISDLLLEVAKEVHGKSTILQKRGEFPAALEHGIPLSDDALRYYKSGKSYFSQKIGSFWLASLLTRVLVAIVPLVLVIIPAIRFLPVAYRLRIQLKLYRWYRPLLRVERETFGPLTPDHVQHLLERLDEIEIGVNHLKVPASFASQFYWLRSHIAFVRQRLRNAAQTGNAGALESPAPLPDVS